MLLASSKHRVLFHLRWPLLGSKDQQRWSTITAKNYQQELKKDVCRFPDTLLTDSSQLPVSSLNQLLKKINSHTCSTEINWV
jgi:hypothetical protein